MSRASDVSPPDTPDLDGVLITIRLAFADIALVIEAMAELRELRPPIDRAITLLTEQES
jgi:hypothetical protein